LELDDVDVGILTRLQQDGRTPFTKIAKELGISDATVHLRVRKLENQNIIEKYTVVINEDHIQPITTYVLIRVTPGNTETVCKELSQIDEIYEVSEIHEQYDILAKVRGRDLGQVRDMLIKRIRSIPNVVGSETYTVYKTWKRDFGINIDPYTR
jgi:Lrp/AsnC family transcriptional regulator for asnA, asnC and gidA